MHKHHTRIEELVGAVHPPSSHGGSHSKEDPKRMREVPEDENPVLAVWENFKIYTTAHGVPHIDHASHWGKRTFWTIIALSCLMAFTYTMYVNASRYAAYEVAVSESMKYQSSLTFPAVTVCNNNPVRLSQLATQPELNALLGSSRSTNSTSNSTSTNSTATTTSTTMSTPSASGPAISTTMLSSTASSAATVISSSGLTSAAVTSGGSTVALAPGGPTSGATTTGATPEATSSIGATPGATSSIGATPGATSSIGATPGGIAGVTSGAPQGLTSSPGSSSLNSPGSAPRSSSAAGAAAAACPASMAGAYGNTPGQGFATVAGNAGGSPPPVAGAQPQQQRQTFQTALHVQQELSELSLAEKEAIGHQISDLIIDCQYGGYTCYTSDFTQFYSTLYGNCFTFNSAWNKSISLQTSYRLGPQYGLALMFNVDQDEYIGTLANSAGLRVVIHDQSRMPFPEDEGVAVAPGVLTYIGNRLTEITREGGVYSDCVDPTVTNYTQNMYEYFYPVGYSQAACYKTCLQHNFVSRCGCADCSYPWINTSASLQPCDVLNTTQMTCHADVMTMYQNDELGCYCPLPCKQTNYDSSVTTHLWPSVSYSTTLWNTLAPLNAKVNAILNQQCDSTKYAQNLGQMVIYLEDFTYTSIDESPDYSLNAFISDTGGILGLYAGFSIFTICEFLELVINLITVSFIQAYRSPRLIKPLHPNQINVAEMKESPPLTPSPESPILGNYNPPIYDQTAYEHGMRV